jgi:Ca2+-binding RTX toxin-like protein
MLMASLFVTTGSTLAVDACTGATEIIDLGDHYLVKGSKLADTIDCTVADKWVEIRGGAGDDYLYGSAYGDVLKGDHGDDWLWGGDGDDWLQGGWGDDYMNGELGWDTCLGGRGFDTFGGSVDPGCDVADAGREP